MPLTLLQNPYDMFDDWFQKACADEPVDPNAMTLATATKGGMPSARMVLLKEHSEDGFVFFTNYNSRKGGELDENPNAALLFYWKSQNRQIRIEGRVEKTDAATSDAYFNTRHPQSRVGTWASQQSRPLESREEMVARFKKYQEQFPGENIPRPDYWGGFRLKAKRFEFWQAGEYRLHDRATYMKDENEKSGWTIQPLYP